MTASGVVCQTMSYTGYGWCVSLLTLLAMGVQGQEVIEPRTPYFATPEDTAEIRKGDGLEIPRSPAQEPLQCTTKSKQAQATMPAENSWCEKTKHCTEKAEQSLLFAKKAECSLLFLTAAGVVCQIGDREWYGLCVLILATMASGDLWVKVEEEDRLPRARKKRTANQENYHLEAYDCNEPEDAVVYHIPQQCPDRKELVSPPTLGGTK